MTTIRKQDTRKLLKLAEEQLLNIQEMLLSEIGVHSDRHPTSLVSPKLLRSYAEQLQELARNIDTLTKYTQE